MTTIHTRQMQLTKMHIRKTTETNHITRRHITEDVHLNQNYSENLKTCNESIFFTQFSVSYRSLLTYGGADKSLARPTSRCILFDGENISFDASLVTYREIVLIFLQLL